MYWAICPKVYCRASNTMTLIKHALNVLSRPVMSGGKQPLTPGSIGQTHPILWNIKFPTFVNTIIFTPLHPLHSDG